MFRTLVSLEEISKYEQDMKKRPWLEIAEYLSLATSAAGTIAAIASQQVV